MVGTACTSPFRVTPGHPAWSQLTFTETKMSQEVLVGIVAGIPLGRIATPAEISKFIRFSDFRPPIV